MTYLEGIERECDRLGIPRSCAPILWAKLLPWWYGHFLLNNPISDSRMYAAL